MHSIHVMKADCSCAWMNMSFNMCVYVCVCVCVCVCVRACVRACVCARARASARARACVILFTHGHRQERLCYEKCSTKFLILHTKRQSSITPDLNYAPSPSRKITIRRPCNVKPRGNERQPSRWVALQRTFQISFALSKYNTKEKTTASTSW